MQKNIVYLLSFSLLIASCGEGKKEKNAALNDKKGQLEKLKTEQQKLNDQIGKLEEEISKLDTFGAVKNLKLVAVAAIQPDSFSHYIDLQGTVTATDIAYVAPPNGQGGIVKALYVKQGDRVSKGQVLARLDDQLIRQQKEPIKVQLTTAEDTYRRTKNLWDQGIGTYQNVLNAQTQVESYKKQIAIYEKQASLMTVTAPQSGVADIVNVRVGESFTGVIAGKDPQISIVNTGDLKITTNVPENYMGKVNVGSNIEIELPDQNNRTISAKVSVVSSAINPGTRSFYIEAKVPAGAKLKPNQVAKVKIKDYGNNNAISIPVNVLQNDEKGKFVLVAIKEKDGLIARKREVTVGELYGNNLEIKSGLQSGDMLITEGAQSLYDGQPITTELK